MKMYQSAIGRPSGRGNLITIDIPRYSHVDENDPFYWDAIAGRIINVYHRLRKRHGLTQQEARDAVWTMAFAIYMAVPVGNGLHFASADDLAKRKELVS